MYRHTLRVLMLFALLWLSGCATHERFVQTYNSWVGQPIDRFIRQAGYPDRTYTLPNKHKVYIYEYNRVVSRPMLMPAFGYTPYWGYYGGASFGYYGDVDYETCKLFLETNEKHIIVRWGYRGNACRL